MFFKKQSLIIIMLLVFLGAQNAYAKSTRIEKLEDLINEATQKNSQILASQNLWVAEENKVSQVRALPDPVVHYGYFGKSVETRVGPQKHKFGASLKVPFPAKLVYQGKMQSKNASIYKEKYDAAKMGVILNLKNLYYELYWVDKAIQITEEEKLILTSLEKIAKRKYESNLTPQQDVIKAQVEITKLIEKLFILKESRNSLVARINAILNRSADAPFNRTENVEPQKMKTPLDELRELASSSRQELRAAHLSVTRAEDQKMLAKLNYVPDFTFGFDYILVSDGQTSMINDGEDALIGSVSMNVPIWFNKLNAEVKEKTALVAASQKNYENMRNDVRAEVDDIYFSILTYGDIIELHKTALIPQTEQAFEAARIGYESGSVDFLNWLDAERTVLHTRLSYYRAISDYQKSVASLERVVGQRL